MLRRLSHFSEMKDGAVLDVGCNSGYNAIYLSQKYGMEVVGIDHSRRHIEVSRFLSDVAGVHSVQFFEEDAESFVRPAEFDVVLHFGTLYHLPNPLLALRSALANLKKGGYLALETQCYDHPEDDRLCYFINMMNNDPTNYWALSTKTLRTCLGLIGFTDVVECLRVTPAGLSQHMSRVLLTARRSH